MNQYSMPTPAEITENLRIAILDDANGIPEGHGIECQAEGAPWKKATHVHWPYGAIYRLVPTGTAGQHTTPRNGAK